MVIFPLPSWEAWENFYSIFTLRTWSGSQRQNSWKRGTSRNFLYLKLTQTQSSATSQLPFTCSHQALARASAPSKLWGAEHFNIICISLHLPVSSVFNVVVCPVSSFSDGPKKLNFSLLVFFFLWGYGRWLLSYLCVGTETGGVL